PIDHSVHGPAGGGAVLPDSTEPGTRAAPHGLQFRDRHLRAAFGGRSGAEGSAGSDGRDGERRRHGDGYGLGTRARHPGVLRRAAGGAGIVQRERRADGHAAGGRERPGRAGDGVQQRRAELDDPGESADVHVSGGRRPADPDGDAERAAGGRDRDGGHHGGQHDTGGRAGDNRVRVGRRAGAAGVGVEPDARDRERRGGGQRGGGTLGGERTGGHAGGDGGQR